MSQELIGSFKVKIKGESWTVRLLEDEAFLKIHTEGKAIFDPKAMNIDFRRCGTGKNYVRHEVMHIFYSYQYNEELDLNLDQQEEIICDIIGYDWDQMSRAWKSIYRGLQRIL